MSERTPQDVLLTALRAVEDDAIFAAFTPHPERVAPFLLQEITRAGYEIRPLDKAIAEAPDSYDTLVGPPPDYMPRFNPTPTNIRHPGIAAARKKRHAAPDTLSEKPGLDVERLAAALHDAMCEVSHHDRDYRSARCFAKYPLIARSTARRYAGQGEATVLSGSTDSEGQ